MRETWFQQTEKMLYEHKIICAELTAWLTERREELMNRSYLPSFSTEPIGSTGRVSKPTETFAILRASFPELPAEIRRKYIQAKQIEAAITAMTPPEQQIYKLKYIEERVDVDIWSELDISKATYYRRRRELVEKVADVLGVKDRKKQNETKMRRF